MYIRLAFPSGRDYGGGCCRTDGLANEEKAAEVRGAYFVFYASHDALMEPSFAPRLLAARYVTSYKLRVTSLIAARHALPEPPEQHPRNLQFEHPRNLQFVTCSF